MSPSTSFLRGTAERVYYIYPRGTHEAEATSEVDWWDRVRAGSENPSHSSYPAGEVSCGRVMWGS